MSKLETDLTRSPPLSFLFFTSQIAQNFLKEVDVGGIRTHDHTLTSRSTRPFSHQSLWRMYEYAWDVITVQETQQCEKKF